MAFNKLRQFANVASNINAYRNYVQDQVVNPNEQKCGNLHVISECLNEVSLSINLF